MGSPVRFGLVCVALVACGGKNDEAGKAKVHFTLVAVLLGWRAGEGEPIQDATALGWFTRDEARALELFPNVEALMEKALGLP